tara:strand:- start:3414 stop:4166 length:753 start_codon:yes stop_codon:yes gene_type:complete
MVNLFDIPVYYISFKLSHTLVKHLLDRGFKDINHFEAIKGHEFRPKDLLDARMITIRTYNDLVSTRTQHSGIPGLGAIGCTMSHHALWNMCVELDLPYMAIAEEDLYLNPITEREQTEIERVLSRPNSLYLGTIAYNENTKPDLIKGAHFYIVSNAACKALVEEAFPIDVQTDYYLLHMGTNKRVDVEGFELGVQKSKGPSSIQDVCVKCILPDQTFIYVIVGIGLLIGIALVAILSRKLMKCKQSLRRT